MSNLNNDIEDTAFILKIYNSVLCRLKIYSNFMAIEKMSCKLEAIKKITKLIILNKPILLSRTESPILKLYTLAPPYEFLITSSSTK